MKEQNEVTDRPDLDTKIFVILHTKNALAKLAKSEDVEEDFKPQKAKNPPEES